MAFSEVATVTLIENHHYLFIAHFLKVTVVIVFGDCAIQLLNSGDYYFLVTSEALYQLFGTVRAINSSGLKGFIFRLCLGVKVVSVNNKKHLVYFIDLRDELCRLK